MRVFGIVSAVVLNLLIWGFLAVWFTLGLAVADTSATTFSVVWVFFAGVTIVGSVLMVEWGQEGRRWLWRVSIGWSVLFLVSVFTLLLALIPFSLLCLSPRFRRWVSSWLVPPRPPTEALAPAALDAQ